MIHLAIDHGKKVSHAVALNDAGEILFDQEILSTLEGFASIKDALPTDQPIHSIVEAGWNWGKAFDALEDLGLNPKLVAYLFEPVPCTVRAAWEKGKVESGIKYVRGSFLAGRPLLDLGILRRELETWLEGTANVRVHGTTRERPLDRFLIEKPLLQSEPGVAYDCAIVASLGSTSQALVQFQTNRYSVPHERANKTLTLKATGQTILIYDGVQHVATHARCYEKYRVIEDPAHYAGMLAKRKKARSAKRVEEFLELGTVCAEYLKGLSAAELNLAAHLDKIMECVRDFGREETLSAIARAQQFGAFGSAYVHNILLQRRAARGQSAPRPVVLSKKPSWAEIAVEETDLGLYDELFSDEKVKGDA